LAQRRLLIAYYTKAGNTGRMAEEISKGAESEGVDVEIKMIESCSLDDLANADGIVVGSPTYFSNVAWQVKKLIDESIALYRKGHQLEDKVGGCFTSSGTRRDGKDCVKMLGLAFGFHHRMKMLPGITRASGDSEAEVSEMCQKYGAKIARKILS